MAAAIAGRGGTKGVFGGRVASVIINGINTFNYGQLQCGMWAKRQVSESLKARLGKWKNGEYGRLKSRWPKANQLSMQITPPSTRTPLCIKVADRTKQ